MMRAPTRSLPTVLILWVAFALLLAAVPSAPSAAATDSADAAAFLQATPPDGDQTGRNVMPGVGPTLPGPDYLAVFDEIASPPRSSRLVADSEGHVLINGAVRVDGESVQRLVALNTDDGSVAWTVDDILVGCLPVATDDGRIFASIVRTADVLGAAVSSIDIVEIDAATGQPTNRYVADSSVEETRLNDCRDELRLGAGGIVVTAGSGAGDLVGIDTTTSPMTMAWRYDNVDAVNDGALDRVVLSPDGSVVYSGRRIVGTDPPQVGIVALDVATGDEVGTATVPGSLFAEDGLLHSGEVLVVHTRATGGQDDPPRLIGLDPDTLAQLWVVEGGRDLPLQGSGRMALAGDNLIVSASSALRAFDITTGAALWQSRLDSFSNNGDQLVVDATGRVYTSSFGGAVLEVHDGTTGARLFQSADSEEFLGQDVAGEALLGPILDDGRLYALHRQGETDFPILAAYGTGNARLDGVTGDPIDIAIQLCQYLFGDDGARTVVLARDDVFADTLAGAPLAGDHSCILFTEGGPEAELDPRTRDEISRALPDGATVRIVGGVNAVSADVEATVSAAGFAVERLAGPGRVETAVAISDVVVEENPGVDTAIVAFANNWPDAVTAGAAAAAIGAPVLLTQTDAVPAATLEALARYGVTTTSVPGGTAVVADSALGQLPGPTRVAGPNRFGTAAAVATTLWDGLSDDGAFVLSNLEFDVGWTLALAASPLSVRLGAPQLGVRADSLPAETEAYLRENGITDPSLLVLGDLTVISQAVVDAVELTETG